MSTRHFNNLTPAEAERLAMLAEECGEVIQAVGKILRHGYASVHPSGRDQGRDNRANLLRELGDVSAIVSLMCGESDISHEQMVAAAFDKLKRLKPYVHHQQGTGL
jgi:NTP pyrophosphatase (non-canonical NTP hydrolase)